MTALVGIVSLTSDQNIPVQGTQVDCHGYDTDCFNCDCDCHDCVEDDD